MAIALMLLALLSWIIVCWAQYRYTASRHRIAEYDRRKRR
jgi:hypothetical protein